MTTQTKRRTASELIATVLCWDWDEVKDCAYQPTRYTSPRVYAIGDVYMAAPTDRQKLPKDLGAWEEAGEAYGRKVYRTKKEST